VGLDDRGKAQWLGFLEGKSAICVGGQGGLIAFIFRLCGQNRTLRPFSSTDNMTIKRRTMGFRLKRLGDGAETRRDRSCGSITLWSSSCIIPCFIFTLEKTIMMRLYSQTRITNYLLCKLMMIRWNCTLKITMTIQISLGCGWVTEEKCDELLLLGVLR